MSIQQARIVLGYLFAGYPDEEIESSNFGGTENQRDEVRQMIEDETGIYLDPKMVNGWVAEYGAARERHEAQDG